MTEPWSPTAFEAFRELYPATPQLPLPDLALTEAFARTWSLPDAELDACMRDAWVGTTVVFVRGYLGNWMPGNLVRPMRAFAALGIDARIATNAAGATVATNARGLAEQLGGDGPVLLCGHSRGGLECLVATDLDARLRERAVGVLLSQTPRGPSGVLESLLLRSHDGTLSGARRWAEEWVQRVGLHAIGAASGGRELTAGPLAEVVRAIDACARPFPVWQTASWSSQPTTWLDSFHGRLAEIRPGCAHDGQFFLEDLLWPGLPHVLLAHVDHAQPVMGGFGFDEVRYWKVLAALFASVTR
ncbi:MAG: hypothetical protein R3F61_24270 [Myxococcota bacterium]